MKRPLFIIASLLFIVACQNQKFPVEKVSADGSFYSTMEEVSATKTSLDGGGSVLWSEGDQVAIYKKSTLKSRFQVTKESVGKAAGSFAQVQEADDGFHAGGEIPHNVVLYPYDAAESCLKNGEDSYKLEVNLPAVQTYAENTFGNGTFPMTAVSENNILTFKNICGGLKLQLTGVDKIRSIVLEGLADEVLSGQGTVIAYVDNSAPVINMDADASKTVTLDCGEEGVQLQEDVPTVFILSVPPVKFTSGLKITVTDTEDFSRVMINRSENNAIKRSTLLSFKPIAYKQDEVLELPDFPDVEEGEAPTYEVVAEGGNVEIPIKTNQDIEVQIPDEAASWIRWVETKAVREETIVLEVEENTTPEPRSAEIFIATTEGVALQSIVFTQEAGDPMKPTDPDEFGLIDLGLSVKWANYNMGATSVSGYGTATDWGHEEGDSSFPSDMNISGTEHDLVKAELGGEWRLPTAFDFMELEQKCTWEPTAINGVAGNLVTGPNGNKIFLPDVVYWTGTAREREGNNDDYVYGVYWTPEGVTETTDKFNRPVQGPVRVYPEVTIEVKEVGKNTAKVEAVIADYDAFGVELDFTLAVASTGRFTVSPTSNDAGTYIFDITDLSSSHTYSLYPQFDIFEWSYRETYNGSVQLKTSSLVDGDGIEAQPVDLGLSVMWAEWNLGASCRSDKGFKLNWGGISINDDVRIDLKDTDITGTQYDPATILWGPEWRLPTPEEWSELVGTYQNLRATVRGVGGVMLQNEIFLPEDGITYYLSGSYNKGCYFLYDAYCYSGSLPATSKSYVRPVYDPLPQLGEVTVSEVTSSTASVSSTVVRIGGGEITKRGFVYSTEENPTLENAAHVEADADFSKVIAGLSAATTYYVRPFATNAHGTSYGKEISFTTEISSGGNESVYEDEGEW